MENGDMGQVRVAAIIFNVGDLYEAKKGVRTPDQVRKVVVPDALVDSGSTTLCLPKRYIDQLGLSKQYEKQAATAGGLRTVGVYESARIDIMGRLATVDPIELPDECPVLVGQMPLEMMDWVIDMKGKKLIGNPAHGGEQVLEVL